MWTVRKAGALQTVFQERKLRTSKTSCFIMGRLKVFLVIPWNEDCSLSLSLLVWRVSEIPRVSIWVSWPELMTEIVLISRSCLLRSHLIQQVAASWVLHEIRQDPTSYPPGRRPSQDQKLLILVRGHLQDLAMQRKPWLTAALICLGKQLFRASRSGVAQRNDAERTQLYLCSCVHQIYRCPIAVSLMET